VSTPARRIAVEEAVAYGFLTAVGGYALVTAFDYPLFNEGNRIGPGLLPAVFAGLITLISGVVQSVVADSTAEETSPHADPEDATDGDVDIFGRTAAQRFRQLQMVTVALIVCLLIVPLVGLLGALALFCLVASIGVERRPWLSSVVITAVSVTTIYLVFSVFLEVPLPAGALGIGG
jgi:hypothetical protein